MTDEEAVEMHWAWNFLYCTCLSGNDVYSMYFRCGCYSDVSVVTVYAERKEILL